MTYHPHWSEEQTRRLGEIIDAGLSSGRAARTLRMPRSAVIGRAARLGWHFGTPRPPEQRIAPFRTLRGERAAPKRRRPVMSAADRPRALTCRFDPEAYAEVCRLAKAGRLSKMQVIRELVEWGLEAARAEKVAA